MCTEHKHTWSEKWESLAWDGWMPSLIWEPVLEIGWENLKVSVELEWTDVKSPQVLNFIEWIKKLYDNIFKSKLTH